MFEMSGLENYQVAVVRGKGRQLGGGGLGEAARADDEATRGEGGDPVRTELGGATILACSRAQNPLLAQSSEGYQAEERHVHFSHRHRHTHTHPIPVSMKCKRPPRSGGVLLHSEKKKHFSLARGEKESDRLERVDKCEWLLPI